MRSTLLPILLLALAPTALAEEGGIGKIPSLVARDLEGKKFDLKKSLAQGPAVLTFWATWCKPCRKELPELQRLVETYGEQGFHVVGVNGDGPVDQAKIRPYVRALDFDFTVIPDPDGEIRRRFQVEVFPTGFLLAPDGTIMHRQVGYRQGDEKILEAKLKTLLPEAKEPEAQDPPSEDTPGQ